MFGGATYWASTSALMLGPAGEVFSGFNVILGGTKLGLPGTAANTCGDWIDPPGQCSASSAAETEILVGLGSCSANPGWRLVCMQQ